MRPCSRCAELEAVNAALLSKLAAIEKMIVPKEKQLIQFAEDAVDETMMPWDRPAKVKKSPQQLGDESLDGIVLPKPGDPEVAF